MPQITRDSLLTLEGYAKVRPQMRAEVMAHKKNRMVDLGDAVQKLKETNIPHLAKLARDGYAILTPVPSCTLMYKQELPLMFPDDADVQAVKEAMWDPFEYLMARNADGLLKTDFKAPLGKVAYHVPCHQRVQNIATRRAMRCSLPARASPWSSAVQGMTAPGA